MAQRRAFAALTAALLLIVLAPAAVRAVEVDWGMPMATATYGESVEFEQPATIGRGIRRVEVLMELPGSIGPVVADLGPAPAPGARTLRHALLLADGHLLPNTTITARWRLVGEDGSEEIGPPVTVRYEDTRFDWRTREGDIVRVHWYEGSDDFGGRALEIGDRAVRETAELLGVTEDKPVDFFVYADQGEFYDALGPGTRENVGGQANSELRTLFALITPNEIDDPWVGVVIPHELVHLVFDTAVDNPYHFPPRWLNEGLAVYLSEGYEVDYRSSVEQATRARTLFPLAGLSAQFPTTRDGFVLAYGESVSAVDFLIREYGQDALIGLVRSYDTGLTDDEAFERAIGLNVADFDAAWRAELGAREPTEYGPRPALAGPLPPGWTTAEGSPGATPAPVPVEPGGPTAPAPGDDASAGSSPLLLVLALGTALLVAAAVTGLVIRGRRREEQAQLARSAAWRDERMLATPAPAPEPEPAAAGGRESEPEPGPPAPEPEPPPPTSGREP